MKKIRLSERELTNIIKRVINEGVIISDVIELTDKNGVEYTINLPDSSGNPGIFVHKGVRYKIIEE